jgi:hypothetical protein
VESEHMTEWLQSQDKTLIANVASYEGARKVVS